MTPTPQAGPSTWPLPVQLYGCISEPSLPNRAPLIALRERLADAHSRGEQFQDAWPTAVALTLVEIAGVDERQQWRHAFEWARSTWERCYNREPATKADRQLSLLRAERDMPVTDHQCRQCGKDFVPKHYLERFCTDECRLAYRRADEPLRLTA